MLQTSNSPCASQSRIPKTPMRRLLCRLELFRPILALGKRTRDPELTSPRKAAQTSTHSDPELADWGPDRQMSSSVIDDAGEDETHAIISSLSSVIEGKTEERAIIAFQLHDRPLDAVVVATLPRFPFFRHEDLLAMSRQELIEVAILFNAHLPRSVQIDLSDGVSASHIRHCIETMVGLIPNVPGAPKATKSRPAGRKDPTIDVFMVDENVDIIPSPPTSPLAMRLTRRQGIASITSGLLESLEEEDEDDLFARQRVLKRRKLSDATGASTLSVYEGDDMQITPIRPLRLSPKFEMTPSQEIRPGSYDIDMHFRSPPRLKEHVRSRVPSFDRFQEDTRLISNLKPASRSEMKLYPKDSRDEDLMSRAMSELGSSSFYSCLDFDDDQRRMDIV